MNRGKIYLTIEDLMELMGTDVTTSAYKAHKAIRDSLGPNKMNLTILEYCKYTGDDYAHIYFELRGEKPQLPD